MPGVGVGAVKLISITVPTQAPQLPASLLSDKTKKRPRREERQRLMA